MLDKLAEQAGRQSWSRSWTRPPVQRTGTEEKFAPVQAKFVRLVVEGAENNPRRRAGYGIDEFEIWTAGIESAQRRLGRPPAAKQRGRAAWPNDFEAAYSANFDDRRQVRCTLARVRTRVDDHAGGDPKRIDRVLFSSDRNADAGEHSVAGVCQ